MFYTNDITLVFINFMMLSLKNINIFLGLKNISIYFSLNYFLNKHIEIVWTINYNCVCGIKMILFNEIKMNANEEMFCN